MGRKPWTDAPGSPKSRAGLATYREAFHKPFVIAAIMLLTRFERPAEVLRQVLDRAKPRRLG